MNGIRPGSWDVPLPDELEETTIDFQTGLKATADCSTDTVVIAVAHGTQIDTKPECEAKGLGGWLRSIIKK
jgi:hypothetical protein